MQLDEIIKRAAMRAHQVDCTCDDGMDCKGPSPSEQLFAAVVVKTALPTLFMHVTEQVTAVVSAMEAGHFAVGDLDATSIGSEELLRLWFHRWRAAGAQPGALEMRTLAFLASEAAQRGQQLRTAADV